MKENDILNIKVNDSGYINNIDKRHHFLKIHFVFK